MEAHGYIFIFGLVTVQGCCSTKEWCPSHYCPRVGHCLDCHCPKDGDPRSYGEHSGDADCPMNGDCPCPRYHEFPGILTDLGMVTVPGLVTILGW